MTEPTLDDLMEDAAASMAAAPPMREMPRLFTSYERDAIRDGRMRFFRRPIEGVPADWEFQSHPWEHDADGWYAEFMAHNGPTEPVPEDHPLRSLTTTIRYGCLYQIACPFPQEGEQVITNGLLIEIENVAVQRVSHVSLEDAIKSGVVWDYEGARRFPFDGPVKAFLAYWDSAFGPTGYAAETRRYCWDVDFKLIAATD